MSGGNGIDDCVRCSGRADTLQHLLPDHGRPHWLHLPGGLTLVREKIMALAEDPECQLCTLTQNQHNESCGGFYTGAGQQTAGRRPSAEISTAAVRPLPFSAFPCCAAHCCPVPKTDGRSQHRSIWYRRDRFRRLRGCAYGEAHKKILKAGFSCCIPSIHGEHWPQTSNCATGALMVEKFV